LNSHSFAGLYPEKIKLALLSENNKVIQDQIKYKQLSLFPVN